MVSGGNIFNWLPNTLNLNGAWEDVLKILFAVFHDDFIDNRKYLESCPVWWDRRKIDSPYDEGFWHLISRKDDQTGERIPDFDRAKKLPWCGPSIENCYDPNIKYFDYAESRGVNTYIWLESHEYVIILKYSELRNGKKVYFLKTAYHIDGESRRRSFLRKYNARII